MTVVERETEVALVAGLRSGDEAAFDAVYDDFHPRIFNFLARLSRRRDVAEDLAEETWLRVVKHASRLEPGTHLAPWLFTVARNVYFSYCRARGFEEPSALLGFEPVAAPSPFDEAAAGELDHQISQALSRMSSRDREVLLLVAGGLTPGEAAAVCALTPEAMRQRLSRARERLARELVRIGVRNAWVQEMPR